MVNVIFVAAGQCGNQLCLELLNYLHQHAVDRKFFAQNAGGHSVESLSRERLIETFFSCNGKEDGMGYEGKPLSARAVCLDTEPKVIDECLRLSHAQGLWAYDPKSIAYRHGGAGNNWALGYAMAEGEFLETSLNCIRRQAERSDGSCLVFLHSLAGGTGSGLGTRITEACRDDFEDLFRLNIAIAPHHFGEVVVQYYNALLCLAKASRASQGMLVFENEVAQMLCKEMRGIDKPSLKDLNAAIASNLLPILLPKISADKHFTRFTGLEEDISSLCSHAGYRFLNVKLTPQTSRKSIDFTYDSWSTLLKTIQRLQLSGTPSERQISRALRNAGSTDSPSTPSGVTAGTIRSVGSVITCHGDQAQQAVQEVSLACGQGQADASPLLVTPKRRPVAGPGQTAESILLPGFLASHSNLLGQTPVSVNSTVFALNRYQRCCSLLSNDQSVLPILQRPRQRAEELFNNKAYLHQYAMHGLEEDQFVEAFRSVSAIIHNYASL